MFDTYNQCCRRKILYVDLTKKSNLKLGETRIIEKFIICKRIAGKTKWFQRAKWVEEVCKRNHVKIHLPIVYICHEFVPVKWYEGEETMKKKSKKTRAKIQVEKWALLFGNELSPILYDDQESAQCAKETDFTPDDDVSVVKVKVIEQ